MEHLDALKDRLGNEIDSMRTDLVTLSKRIYENPEIGFQEHPGWAMPAATTSSARGAAARRGGGHRHRCARRV